MDRTPPEPGRYRHYKGNEYDVVAIAQFKGRGHPVVVYRAVPGGGWFVRTVTSWNSTTPSGVPRFEKI